MNNTVDGTEDSVIAERIELRPGTKPSRVPNDALGLLLERGTVRRELRPGIYRVETLLLSGSETSSAVVWAKEVVGWKTTRRVASGDGRFLELDSEIALHLENAEFAAVLIPATAGVLRLDDFRALFQAKIEEILTRHAREFGSDDLISKRRASELEQHVSAEAAELFQSAGYSLARFRVVQVRDEAADYFDVMSAKAKADVLIREGKALYNKIIRKKDLDLGQEDLELRKGEVGLEESRLIVLNRELDVEIERIRAFARLREERMLADQHLEKKQILHRIDMDEMVARAERDVRRLMAGIGTSRVAAQSSPEVDLLRTAKIEAADGSTSSTENPEEPGKEKLEKLEKEEPKKGNDPTSHFSGLNQNYRSVSKVLFQERLSVSRRTDDQNPQPQVQDRESPDPTPVHVGLWPLCTEHGVKYISGTTCPFCELGV